MVEVPSRYRSCCIRRFSSAAATDDAGDVDLLRRRVQAGDGLGQVGVEGEPRVALVGLGGDDVRVGGDDVRLALEAVEDRQAEATGNDFDPVNGMVLYTLSGGTAPGSAQYGVGVTMR